MSITLVEASLKINILNTNNLGKVEFQLFLHSPRFLFLGVQILPPLNHRV